MKAIRCTIQSLRASWPRPLYVSIHGYDWTPMCEARDGRAFAAEVRVFGFGFEYRWDRMSRFYLISLGADWLINLAAGFKGVLPKSEQFTAWAGTDNRFAELTLFGLQFCWGKAGDEPLRFRIFWRHELIWPRRSRHG